MASIVTYPQNRRVWKSAIVCKFNGTEFKEDSDFKIGVTNRTDEFYNLNPFGQVPTLKLAGGKGVFESNSIARYFARLGEKKKPLLGGDIVDQSRVDGFLDAVLDLETYSGPWAYKFFKFPWAAAFTRQFVETCQANTKNNFRAFNRALKGKDWLVGNSITLADIVWWSTAWVSFAHLLDAKFREEIPYAVSHFKKLAQLAEFKAVAGELPKFPDTEPVLEFQVQLPPLYHRLVTITKGSDVAKFKFYESSQPSDLISAIRSRFGLGSGESFTLNDEEGYDVVVDGTLETGNYHLSLTSERKGAPAQATVITLNTRAKLPLVGLGTWKSKPGEVGAALENAIDVGYRHIDCAAVYGNEKEIGESLAKKIGSTVRREELFITSKLWNAYHEPEHVEPALRQTLADLKLDYLDLYLIHWPLAFAYAGAEKFPKHPDGTLVYKNVDIVETWKAMEKVLEKGLTKAIGLSNFNSEQITRILKEGKIKPACLQIEAHAWLNQEKLINFAFARGIKVVAYSPLGSSDRPWAKETDPVLLQDAKVAQVAKKYNRSPAQILLRFNVQRGVVVIPKSVKPHRLQENKDLFNFQLSESDMEFLRSLNKPLRLCIPTIQNAKGEVIPRDGAHPEYPFNIEF